MMTSGYPENWNEIANAIKQQSGYCCQRCGMQCLPPGNSYRHLPRRVRSKYTAQLGETHAEGYTSARFHPQVHHRDRQPFNNNPNNLVTLCTGCHLYYHQGKKGNITPGQLSLSLAIDLQDLTPPGFQHQLSLAIDIHQNELNQASNVSMGIQLSLISIPDRFISN